MIGVAAVMSGHPLKSHFKTAPSADEPICKAAGGDADIENLLVDTAGEGEVGQIERVAGNIYTLLDVKQVASGSVL